MLPLPRNQIYAGTVMPDSLMPLARLMATLQERATTRPAGSYTTKLLDGGPPKIGEKILEEAAELIEAAAEASDDGRAHFVYEAGDLIYHTLVLLAWRGVSLDEVAAELARREGTSGLTEKANRSNSPKSNP
jgi:phosphoribosyl-ATP pyrophosphohydrolase